MKTTILNMAELFDGPLSVLQRPSAKSSDRLVTLLVHSLYERESTPHECGIYPHERMTVQKLREFIETFLAMGYVFVSPDDLLCDEPPCGKTMLLTFDDGYYNNTRALPLLKEYDIPATWLISPYYALESQSFWWDAFYRHSQSSGDSLATTMRQIAKLRQLSFTDVYQQITSRWGKDAMAWASDEDRPFCLGELKDFAREPYVHLGNHTFHHAALPFQSKERVVEEVELADSFFRRELQQSPKIVSYPNGDYTEFSIQACERIGLRLGLTIDARGNNPVHLSTSHELMSLGRFMLSGVRSASRQARSIDLSHSLSNAIRRLKNHRYEDHPTVTDPIAANHEMVTR